MKRVIVTGATSFIGVHFIHCLLSKDKDTEIIAVVRENSPKIGHLPKDGRLTVVETGMDSYGKLGQMIGRPCDCLFHLAWSGTRGADRMDAFRQRENCRCSVEAVKSAAKLGCKTIVSAGSQAEYGNHNGPITEETICRPNTEYGKQKLLFFHTAQEFCRKNGLHFKEPRFFSLYGPGDFEGTMVLSVLKKMLCNRPCELTECVQKWDFLYIDDAVRGVERLISAECADGAYNFGSGESRELKFFIQEMAAVTQSKSILRYGAVPYPATGMVSLEPAVKKLQAETGWKNKTSFCEGIQRTVACLRRGEPYENNQRSDTNL